MVSNTSDIILAIIIFISAADFFIYAWLFLSYMVTVPYKARELSTKITSVFVIIFTIIFKLCYIPVFSIPLKKMFGFIFPYSGIFTNTLTYMNVSFSIIPVFLASWSTITQQICTIKNVEVNRKINIVMPIYNEKPEALMDAIKSVKNLLYPKELIHLYLSFDEGVLENGSNSDAFYEVIKSCNVSHTDTRYRIDHEETDGLKMSFCRFSHGGKKSAQFGAFKEIEKDNDNLKDSLVLFIDSDIILHEKCILEFLKYMEHYDKSGLTGMINCIASQTNSFISYYQDAEYISGQIFWRNLESFCGSTICLPGAFTILKYSFIKKVSDDYFLHGNDFVDNSEYQRFYLGEDRYLTHLLMEIEPWKLGFCESAKCKTYAPSTVRELLRQRRRWYLGHMSNDVWMLCSLKLWKLYPFLSLFNLFNNIRNVSVYIYVSYFAFLLNHGGESVLLWFIFIILPSILNFVFIIIYSLKIKRKTNIPFYVIFIAFQPIINMVYMYYTLWNIREKGWGGVRTMRKSNEIHDDQFEDRMSCDATV